MSTTKRVVKCLLPYWFHILLLLCCVAAVTAATLIVPTKLGELFNVIQGYASSSATGSEAADSLRLLNVTALTVVAVYVAKSVFTYGQTYLSYFLGQRVAVDLRDKLFRHVQRLSMSFHERQRSGEIVSRFTNDVSVIQNALINGATDLISQTAVLVGALVRVFLLNWRLALLMVVMMPLVTGLVGRLGKRVRTLTSLVQAKIADATSILQETLSGIRVVKAFTMEDLEIERFARENENAFELGMKSARIGASMVPAIEMLAVVGLSFVLWLGGREVLAGRLSIGDVISFLLLIAVAAAPLSNLSRIYHGMLQGLAASDRVFDILDLESEIADAPGAVELKSIRGAVELDNVVFGYGDGTRALDGVSVSIKPGQTVALVGPSGAGKTTFANLIPRFFDPDEGVVRIDGVDIRNVKIESLRKQIGLVPQETILFGVSVRENIAVGNRHASFAQIVQAAKVAYAHDFIMKLPQGYETQVGERGVTLSGGQRQRIAIARAILRNPAILILDEATSSLDTESEKLVQAAVDNLLKGRTTFIIAHRLSTIINADLILVMDNGKIVESGSHEELIRQRGLYARLYAAQFIRPEVV
ncbi:MAG: ABC transporter ATP-binding protein [Bacillota bacterium]|jgi:subfamily B ATP-binding cassette protein MsbA